MTTRQPAIPATFGRASNQIFIANDRINRIPIAHLDPAAWRAKPPGKVRTIAAIFTHIHNVRTKWIRLTAPHLKVPRKLHRARCTQQQARVSSAGSATRCVKMLAEILGSRAGRIKKFRRNTRAKPWPAGPEMPCYMLSHEAHHRGQVFLLSRQLGILCRKRRHAASGIGKNCGRSAGIFR